MKGELTEREKEKIEEAANIIRAHDLGFLTAHQAEVALGLIKCKNSFNFSRIAKFKKDFEERGTEE